ncbi:MAG: hypothetical protein MR896_00905 [Clostridiales bacterium]|nr:hypothetical protein [Clostridiales bacterium]
MNKKTARRRMENGAEYHETYREKSSRERLRRQRKRRRMAMLRTVLACTVMVALAASVLHMKMVKTTLSDEIVEKKAAVADLDSEYTRLKAEKESSMSLSEVEDYAENVLGLVRLDRSQEEYLAVEKPDHVEVNSGSSSMDKLVSSFVRSFNAVLSFLR